MTRREARCAAVQLIYENMLGGEGGDDTIFGLLELKEAEPELDFARELAAGVVSNAATLDELIRPHLVDWTIDRLAKVDLAILRLALYEITKIDSIPTSVSINEAVDLAREFSSLESSAFINAALGSCVRAMGR